MTGLIITGAAVLVFALYLFMIAPRIKRPELLKRFEGKKYAHRGLHDISNGIPENTLAAFGRAADHGYGMEFDVRFSKDKKLIVLHDDSLKRMTGCHKRACELTMEELEKLTIAGTQEKLPRFEEVLRLIDGRVPLIIELKVCDDDYAELAKAVCKALEGYEGSYVLESFDPRLVRWLKKNRPDIVRGQLLQFFHKHGDMEISSYLDFMIHNHLINFRVRPDFIATYYEDRRSLSMKLTRFFFNTPEFDWTVTSQKQADDCESDGAAYIFERFIPKGEAGDQTKQRHGFKLSK